MGERNPLLKILKDSGNSETLLDPEYFSEEKKIIVLDEKYENITEKMEVYHKQFLNDWHEMTQYFQQTEELMSIEEFMKRTESSPEKIPKDIYEALHYIHGYSQICASEPATCSIGDADEKQMEDRFGETPIVWGLYQATLTFIKFIYLIFHLCQVKPQVEVLIHRFISYKL